MIKMLRQFWIPDLPYAYRNAWKKINPEGRAYYETIARKYYKQNQN